MIEMETLLQECKNLWLDSNEALLQFPVYDKTLRKQNEAQLQKQLAMMKTTSKEAAMQLMKQILDISWMSEADQIQFEDCTTRFVQDAKAFDEHLSKEEIFQALRNMWIIWMLEVAFEKPIVYHQAMFGYSMLYPYSDNILDDNVTMKEDKMRFNQWFMQRLHHEILPYPIPVAKQIDALVSCMEAQYDRNVYGEVYQSLYLIQEGQQRSVSQQEIRSVTELLDISVFKGGASVLADGYLIDGSLNARQQQFCMNFGFALQIADDLQDMEEDQKHTHHTLATTCDPIGRKQLLAKLWTFLQKVVEQDIQNEKVRTFIVKNCRNMLLMSAVSLEHYYPEEFVRRMEEAMPLSKEFLQDIKEKLLMNLHEQMPSEVS